jgi:hypothetical protein
MSNLELIPQNQLQETQDRHVRQSMTRNGKTRLFTVIFNHEGKPRIPSFDSVQVSTMTIIVYTNLVINIRKVFRYLPTTPWKIIKKKRGRKKRAYPEDSNADVRPGSVISIKHKNDVRGVCLKPPKPSNGNSEYWRHSVCVVMILDELKMLNVKVSRNGKFQITGCKSMKHAMDFVKYLYSLMIEAEEWSGETLFSYKTNQDDEGGAEANEEYQTVKPTQNKEQAQPLPSLVNTNELRGNFSGGPGERSAPADGLVSTFKCVMKNIDFDAGYKIRRNRLNALINHKTDFRSIFESSIGTSVNIKLKASHHSDPEINRLRITGAGEVIEDTIPYEEFVSGLSAKAQKEERAKEAYHTFLVFASGSIIMSSAGREMDMVFYKLVRILVQYRGDLEEAPEDEIMESGWLDAPMDKVPDERQAYKEQALPLQPLAHFNKMKGIFSGERSISEKCLS